MKSLFVLLFLAASALAQTGASHFDYNKSAPLDVQQVGSSRRETINILEITYASPRGGRVPAYLVLPAGEGPFPAVIFAHWANTEHSPKTSNKTEFLDEAVLYAKAGTICLLIDAPFARPGFKEDPDALGTQETDVLTQQVIDLRRGVDLLTSRKDVKDSRIAYVGHSFDAGVGGILRGVEPRIAALVLMAGDFATRELVNSNEPDMVAFRKKYGDKAVNAYLDNYDWADGIHYVTLPGKAPVLLQMATHDEFGSAAMFETQAGAVAAPKAVKWYDATHALNAEARLDRYIWLRKYIGLGDISEESLAKVPQLR
jgi:cephalosporin-C deacetylase-like acetyl esterase